jgi:hypothetical protein
MNKVRMLRSFHRVVAGSDLPDQAAHQRLMQQQVRSIS